MIWAVDENGYRQTRKLADEEHLLITTHVAETTFELQTSATLYGQTDTEFLSDIGFLGPMCSPYTACNAPHMTFASCITMVQRSRTTHAATCIWRPAARRFRRCCGPALPSGLPRMGRQAATTTASSRR